jgi:hypothetical protein
MNKLLKRIVELGDEILEQNLINVTKDKLEDNGSLYYMNDIEGTLFDWGMNNRLCEFMMFYDESGMGAIKINILSNGTVNIYLYKDRAKSSFKNYSKTIFTKEEVYELVVLMYHIADKENLYGKSIHQMKHIDVSEEMYNNFEKLFNEE